MGLVIPDNRNITIHAFSVEPNQLPPFKRALEGSNSFGGFFLSTGVNRLSPSKKNVMSCTTIAALSSPDNGDPTRTGVPKGDGKRSWNFSHSMTRTNPPGLLRANRAS